MNETIDPEDIGLKLGKFRIGMNTESFMFHSHFCIIPFINYSSMINKAHTRTYNLYVGWGKWYLRFWFAEFKER